MMFLARKLAPAVSRINNLLEGPGPNMSEADFDAWRDDAASHFDDTETSVMHQALCTQTQQKLYR
jgi:hypothetical protein